MSEIKITPNRIKSRLDTTEEIVNKHETQSNKNYPTRNTERGGREHVSELG